MPANRGSMREEHDAPDTKVPITYVPRTGSNRSTKISTTIVRLNLGEYNSQFHYGALAYISSLKKYVLFYRVATDPWTVDRFIVLKKRKEDSLDMIDTDKKIQELMDKCQGMIPVSNRKKTRKNIKRANRTRKNKKL
jgi:hypothetical protein